MSYVSLNSSPFLFDRLKSAAGVVRFSSRLNVRTPLSQKAYGYFYAGFRKFALTSYTVFREVARQFLEG